jgi:uncharacterized surface protein with fasciclin (FAS1) repeats
MMKRLFTKTGLTIVLVIFLVWACNKSGGSSNNPSTNTLTNLLTKGTNTTIFYSAVKKAGLDTVFSTASIFTLLVPTDLACTQSGFSQNVIDSYTADQAKAWVLYQTYAGTALNFQSFIGLTETKLVMADGDSVFITGDSNITYVNGFQFLNSQASASNGIMLALQNVLLPPNQNLLQMIATDSTLSFVNQAIQLATQTPDSLNALLSTGGPFTFIAPVNTAFRNLGFNSPSDLSTVNPDTLRSMILMSIIPQRLFSYDIADSSRFVTVSDTTLQFTNSGIQPAVQRLNGDTTANILSVNPMAINGVLFKTDGVLNK